MWAVVSARVSVRAMERVLALVSAQASGKVSGKVSASAKARQLWDPGSKARPLGQLLVKVRASVSEKAWAQGSVKELAQLMAMKSARRTAQALAGVLAKMLALLLWAVKTEQALVMAWDCMSPHSKDCSSAPVSATMSVQPLATVWG